MVSAHSWEDTQGHVCLLLDPITWTMRYHMEQSSTIPALAILHQPTSWPSTTNPPQTHERVWPRPTQSGQKDPNGVPIYSTYQWLLSQVTDLKEISFTVIPGAVIQLQSYLTLSPKCDLHCLDVYKTL